MAKQINNKQQQKQENRNHWTLGKTPQDDSYQECAERKKIKFLTQIPNKTSEAMTCDDSAPR